MADFNVRKIYSVVEGMGGCKSSIEIVMVSLKECITRTNTFGNKHTTAKIITQISDCKITRGNKSSVL